MGRQGEETDIDYILSHLQDPAGLLDPEFLVWLQVPVHRKLFEEIRNQQEAFMRFSMEDSIDVDREYERLQAKIRFSHRRSGWRWMVAAACVVVVFGVSLVFRYTRPVSMVEEKPLALLEGRKTAELILASGERIHLEKNRVELRESNGTLIVNDSSCSLAYHRDASAVGQTEEKAIVYHTLVIPAGADYTLTLADGTNVRLNCETKFRFPVEFSGKERKVFLDGEAYFEVKRNVEKPFIVRSEAMQVRVLGTVFNLKSDQMNRLAVATLIKGEIEVKGNHNEGMIVLAPGQKAELNAVTRRLVVKQVDTGIENWHNNQFVFENADIFTIARTLENSYGVKIILAPDMDATKTYSGTLKKKNTVEDILNLIKSTNAIPIEYKIVGNSVFLSPKK